MLTKKQLAIFEAFSRNISGESTQTQLKNASREKSNNTMQNAIRAFKGENLITERQIGTAKLYRLNLLEDRVYDYLSLIFKKRIPRAIQSTLDMVKSEIGKCTLFYSLVVFGSYADKTAAKESDLDLAIIIPDKAKEHSIKTALNTVRNRSLIEIDAHVITEDEFSDMLRQDYENLGKEIVRKNLPVHNIGIFYRLWPQYQNYT